MNRSGKKFNPGVQFDRLRTLLDPREAEAFRFFVSGSRANEGKIPGVKYRRGPDASDTDLTIVVPDVYEETRLKELNEKLQIELEGTGLDIQVVKQVDKGLVEQDFSQEIKLFPKPSPGVENRG